MFSKWFSKREITTNIKPGMVFYLTEKVINDMMAWHREVNPWAEVTGMDSPLTVIDIKEGKILYEKNGVKYVEELKVFIKCTSIAPPFDLSRWKL